MIGRRDQRNGLSESERNYDQEQRSDPPERNYQAKKEHEIVGSGQEVGESHLKELFGRLVPRRIEPDKAGIIEELVGAGCATGRNNLEVVDHAHGQLSEPRM